MIAESAHAHFVSLVGLSIFRDGRPLEEKAWSEFPAAPDLRGYAAGSDTKRLYRAVQLRAELQQLLALSAALADALQVLVAELMDAFAMLANLADGIALLGGSLGDTSGHAGDGANRRDDLVQGAIRRFSFAGSGFGMFDLGAHRLYGLMCGLLQAADDILDFRGGIAGAL